MGVEIGTLAVRRSILIEAPPEQVWQEFTTLERMQAWFGTGHRLLEYEPKVSGAVLLEVDIDGEALRFGGTITVFEAEREVTWDNDWIPNRGWAEPTMITLRLTPALGGTLVELFHHAFERTGPDAAEEHRGYEGGWTMRQLETLREVIDA